MFEQLRAQFAEDVRTSSWRTACGRLGRLAGFAARHWPTFRGALADASYRRHVALVAPGDGYFFAARRAYLVCGLSLPARARAALVHYRNETAALDEAYHQAVYQGVGLPLWQHAHEGTVFDIRLTPGNDLLYEGGLSVTFYANGERITVLSYSNLEPSLLDGAAPAGGTGAPREPLVPFVTRRQSSQHAFRKAFTDAFDRGTPGHFCMAALEGIALAQGSGSLRGVPADRHPAYELSEPEHAGPLRARVRRVLALALRRARPARSPGRCPARWRPRRWPSSTARTGGARSSCGATWRRSARRPSTPTGPA